MAKNIKKKSSGVLVGVAAATVLIGTIFGIRTASGKSFQAPAYVVTHVTDGDTFETSEQLGVRLALLDAPDKGNCGFKESKESLEKLVLNKPIYLKILVKDSYGRLVALAYNQEGLVNAQMVKKGQAYYRKKEKVSDDVVLEMKRANDFARQNELGIFGEECTQIENKSQPNCNIKGNYSSKNKFYLVPGCQAYSQTVVQKYLGDKWFCSEEKAIEAGFSKAGRCP